MLVATNYVNHQLEDPVILAKMYANLSTEVGLVILSTLVTFIRDHTVELLKADSVFLESVFNTLVMFLRTRQSKRLLDDVSKVIAEFIHDFR